jgi:predicted transglutaminase-like cysteine proteinase
LSNVSEKLLQKILLDVHFRFDYTYDADQYGGEHWPDVDMLDGIPTGREKFKDDCDGFALMCRAKCRELGIRSRLVFCRTSNGTGHLILEVKGYLLNNIHKWVMTVDQLPDWEFISISGFETGDPWHRIVMD